MSKVMNYEMIAERSPRKIVCLAFISFTVMFERITFAGIVISSSDSIRYVIDAIFSK